MINWRTLIAASLFGSILIAGAAAKTLHIGLAEDPDVLDPTLSRTFVSGIVRTALCDKLFDIGLELEIVPQLATDWSGPTTRRGWSSSFAPGSNSMTASRLTRLRSNTASSAI